MSHQFQIGQSIHHPTFGVGRIEAFRYEGYYARFPAGVRVVTNQDHELAKNSKPISKKKR